MKKILSALLVGLLMFSVAGCGAEPQHTISYVGAERTTILDEYDCIAVYTQYTNGSSESALAADWVNVKAYQHGIELGVIVPTGEKTNGYIQCDTSVQSGITADVVWYFMLDDESEVSIEMTGNNSFTVPVVEE